MSLIGRPSVLFLDEPTTGLDPRSRLAMWDLIDELVPGGHHHAAHDAVPRRGRPPRRRDRRHRPRRGDRAGHARRAEATRRRRADRRASPRTRADAARGRRAASRHFACGDAHVEDGGQRIVGPRARRSTGIVPARGAPARRPRHRRRRRRRSPLDARRRVLRAHRSRRRRGRRRRRRRGRRGGGVDDRRDRRTVDIGPTSSRDPPSGSDVAAARQLDRGDAPPPGAPPQPRAAGVRHACSRSCSWCCSCTCSAARSRCPATATTSSS